MKKKLREYIRCGYKRFDYVIDSISEEIDALRLRTQRELISSMCQHVRGT